MGLIHGYKRNCVARIALISSIMNNFFNFCLDGFLDITIIPITNNYKKLLENMYLKSYLN